MSGISTGNPFWQLSSVIKYRANIICTAPCFKTRRCWCFCRSWPTLRWETCHSKQLFKLCFRSAQYNVNCISRASIHDPAHLQLRSHLFWSLKRGVFFTFVLLQPYAKQYTILYHTKTDGTYLTTLCLQLIRFVIGHMTLRSVLCTDLSESRDQRVVSHWWRPL